MRYKIIRIEEPDFGCEGRPEGQAVMDTVFLSDESGEEMQIKMEDSLLYERNLNEGDQVTIDGQGRLQSVVAVVTEGAGGIGKCICREFKRVGNPMDIANMVLFLCSGKAGFITGENICIDGGMTRQMIYHDDYGWKLLE